MAGRAVDVMLSFALLALGPVKGLAPISTAPSRHFKQGRSGSGIDAAGICQSKQQQGRFVPAALGWSSRLLLLFVSAQHDSNLRRYDSSSYAAALAPHGSTWFHGFTWFLGRSSRARGVLFWGREVNQRPKITWCRNLRGQNKPCQTITTLWRDFKAAYARARARCRRNILR